MNWLLGLDKVWDKLDGSKTYLGGGIALLQGAAGLLSEILKLVADKDALEVWNFVKGLPADQNVALLAAGLVAVGLRHAVAKAADAPAAK